MDSSISLVLPLLILCGLTSGQTGVETEFDRDILSGDFLSVSSPGEVYLLNEGGVLNVCCNRAKSFSNSEEDTDDIEVTLIGTSVDADFDRSSAVIAAGSNCVNITTLNDIYYERSKAFTVLLESENMDISINYSVVLKDDDGPDIECSNKFVKTRNITDIIQKEEVCISPTGVDECSETLGETVDCTRWNAATVSAVPTTYSDTLFLNIDSESCVAALMDLLNATYSAREPPRQPQADFDDQECFTDCTAVLYSGCSASVFLLDDVNARSISNLTRLFSTLLPQQCGIFSNITCCTQSFPERCLGPEPISSVGEADGNQLATVVGGVVGSLVGLSCLIVTAVAVGVAVCVTQRKKRQKQIQLENSRNVRSIVYKPKVESNVLQQSTKKIPPFMQESEEQTVPSPTTQPYEEVTYTESYSEWKKTFERIMIDANHLQYGDVIGEGEFSVVYQAEYTAPQGSTMQVAVKNLKNVTEHEEVEKFIKESAIMLDFNHRNILNLMGVCFNTEDNLPAIVLPYMTNGDLRTFLKEKKAEMGNSSVKYPEGLSETVLLGMCMDVARGMHYLSQCKFVHRDLAARNCMVDENMVVKVADFGLSRDIHVSDYYRLKHRQKLPVKWMAPESLFTKIYTQKTDVWSFGIVCWEIFKFGKKPYPGIDNPDLPSYISHGFRPKKPSRAPDKLFQLMQQTWMGDPQDRPDFREVVLDLASMMGYKGDIRRELEAETENCSKLRVKPYRQVELSSSHQENPPHAYSVLEQPEPVYSNYSREGSPKSRSAEPEEYEVPSQCNPNSAKNSMDSIPLEYEVPQSTPEGRKITKSRSAEPEEYEVPSQCIANSETNSVDSTPLEYEVPQSMPERRKTNGRVMPTASPSTTPAPRRKKRAPNTAMQNQPSADDEIHYEVPSSSTKIPSRYSTLSYPAVQKAMSVPDSKVEAVSVPRSYTEKLGYNSLPSKFHHKSHVYQTLEPNN